MNDIYDNNMRFIPLLKFLDKHKYVLIASVATILLLISFFVVLRRYILHRAQPGIKSRLGTLNALPILVPLTAQPPIRGYCAKPTPLIFLHIIFHHIVDDPLALSIPPSLKAKDIVKLLSKCVKCAVSDQFFRGHRAAMSHYFQQLRYPVFVHLVHLLCAPVHKCPYTYTWHTAGFDEKSHFGILWNFLYVTFCVNWSVQCYKTQFCHRFIFENMHTLANLLIPGPM